MTGQGNFGKTHSAGEANQLLYRLERFFGFDLDFHLKTITECLCIAAQYRTRFSKMSRHLHNFFLKV